MKRNRELHSVDIERLCRERGLEKTIEKPSEPDSPRQNLIAFWIGFTGGLIVGLLLALMVLF